MKNTQIVICGAGIAGVATAYYLAVKCRQPGVVLVDRLQALSLTTSKSGENIRDYWPQPCMASLSERSIELMEELAAESGDSFKLRFSGYDFVSESAGREIFPSEHLRGIDDTNNSGPDGRRLEGMQRPVHIIDRESIRQSYSWLSDDISQIVHIPRAGTIDVYALGSLLLDRARRAGVEVLQARVSAIHRPASGSFDLQLDCNGSMETLHAEKLVLAAGPFTSELAYMLGIELPIENFLQRKIVIRDPQRIVPRDMPFTVFADPQQLNWNDEERELISADPDYRWLLDEFPAGLHIKPESRDQVKLGWAYNRLPEKPRWELEDDVDFPNIVMRGASRFMPALRAYVEELPTPVVQMAGYYSRTPENWPLIGPLEVEGVFAVAALSGFGTMAACAAGELCAAWMTDAPLPGYARNFHPDRYSDPGIMTEISKIESDGQL
jgi:glycine/D-amino acid oxidase-like deaminating enzyme